MHTSLPDTEEALPLLLAQAPMPVMAYPESGYFRAPDWEFAEVDPAAFADAAMGWVARGVRIVGGCCGLGPEHIAALAAGCADRDHVALAATWQSDSVCACTAGDAGRMRAHLVHAARHRHARRRAALVGGACWLAGPDLGVAGAPASYRHCCCCWRDRPPAVAA